ncbi:hypothetical protein [Aeromonas molluscorum]|uniref:Uncharacterized protein n=1 Tax=Aeromonas molluscorum 848 TaxID=1268236 RepID=R1H241_9GAMM|nr:hypothetical protein [Aeromonas molluscorum]EOD54716.1 hypothetical protein G113_12925 [Aeromonas molluscorum 848]
MEQEPTSAGQDSAAVQQREWDRQSIYLRLQEGSPMVFWVWGEEVVPLLARPDLFDHDGGFGWGRESAECMALAIAIVAKLVEVGLVDPGQTDAKSRYLHDEVLVKLPADEHRDLHLSYLRLLLG